MQQIDPMETTRAYAWEMWMNAPMPMVTFFKTLDVTRVLRMSRRHGLKFNMLICWCIGRAASQVREFYTLPVDGRLMKYDSLAVNTIVANSMGRCHRVTCLTMTVSLTFQPTMTVSRGRWPRAVKTMT